MCYLGYGGWLNAEWLWVFSVPPLGIFCGKPGFFLFSFGGSIMGFFEKLYGITRIRPPERANFQYGNFPVRHTNAPHPLGSGAPTILKSPNKTQPHDTSYLVHNIHTTYKIFPNRQSNPYHIRCSLKPPTGISHMQHLSHPLVTNQIHDRLILAPLQFDSVLPTGTEASYCTR